MCKNSGDGENASKIKKSIEDALDIVISAFEKQLDALFAGRALDIETERLKVLQSIACGLLHTHVNFGTTYLFGQFILVEKRVM